MAGLTDTVELDVAQALRGIDSIESALTQATQGFKVGLVDALSLLSRVEIDADAQPVTQAIDAALDAADTTVEVQADVPPVLVEADTSEIPPAVAGAVDAADTTVEVEPSPEGLAGITDAVTSAVDAADTTVNATVTAAPLPVDGVDEATASLDGLQEQAAETGDSLGAVGSAATILNTSSTLAAGQMRDLRRSLPSTGVLGGVAGGFAAVAGAAGVFARSAIDAEQAEERWNRTLGESAERVAQIDVGGLATDIDTLATQVGSDDEALRSAAANIFELGVSSGAARPELEATTERIVALGARAVALRPSLGDAGAVTDQLTAALARGGRALVPYGIALSSTEIAARALRDTGKATVDELSIYERAAAGAALVTERLGASLATDIQSGSESGVIRLRSLREEFANVVEELGAPIAPTFIRTLEAAQGPLTDLVTIGARLVEEVLPIAVDLVEAAGPALDGAAAAAGLFANGLGLVAELVQGIPDWITEDVAAYLLFARVTRELAVLSGIYTRVRATETAVTTAGAAADKAAAAAKLEYAGAAGIASRVTGDAKAGWGGLRGAVASLVSPLGLVTAGLAIGAVAFANHRKEQAETRRQIEETSEAFADQSESIGEDIEAITKRRFTPLADDLRDLGVSFEDLTGFARQGEPGVVAYVRSLADAGEITDRTADAFAQAASSGMDFGQMYDFVLVRGGELNDSQLKTIRQLDEMQKELRTAARERLEVALADGEFTAAELTAAEASNRLRDGGVDYVAVLQELVPEQEAAAGALDATAAATADAAEAADHLLDRYNKLTVEQDAFQRGLDLAGPGLLGLVEQFAAGTLTAGEFRTALANTGLTSDELLDALVAGKQVVDDFDGSLGDALSRTLDEIGPKFGAVADEAIRGKLTHEEYLNVLDRTGLTADELDASLDVAKESVRGFADEVVATVPTVQDAFDDLGEKPGLAAFVNKVEDQAKDLAAFTANVAELTRRGADELAAALLEEGPTAAGAAVAGQAVKLGDAALAARERQIEKAEASTEASEKRLESLAIRHGERMVGIQTGNNSLLSAVPGPDLSTPLITAAERAAASLRAEGRRLVRQAARDVVGEAANIEANQFTRIHSRGEQLGRELATGVIAGTDQSAVELFRAGERAADAVDAGLRKGLEISSPSRVGDRRGGQYLEGVAAGLSRTGSVDAAMASLAAGIAAKPLTGVAAVGVRPVVAAQPPGAAWPGAAGGPEGDGRLVAETAALRAQHLESLVLLRRLNDTASGIGDSTASAMRRTGSDSRFAPAAMR